MKFGRYLALMASTWVLAALAVAAFTLLVDAIGISPVRVVIAGFNAGSRSGRTMTRSRSVTTSGGASPRRSSWGHPESSSQSIPSLWPGPHSRPLTMAALMAVRNSRRSAPIFRIICGQIRTCTTSSSRSLRQAVRKSAVRDAIGSHRRAGHKTAGHRFWTFCRHIRFRLDILLGRRLGFRIRTVSMNRRNPAAVSFEDGFAPIPLATHHFSVKNVFNFVLHTGFMQRGAVLPSAPMAAARRMIEDCNSASGRMQVLREFHCTPTCSWQPTIWACGRNWRRSSEDLRNLHRLTTSRVTAG